MHSGVFFVCFVGEFALGVCITGLTDTVTGIFGRDIKYAFFLDKSANGPCSILSLTQLFWTFSMGFEYILVEIRDQIKTII